MTTNHIPRFHVMDDNMAMVTFKDATLFEGVVLGG